MNFKNVDNTALVKSDEWEGNRDNIVLEFTEYVSARKCEKSFTDFDSVVKKMLDPDNFAANLNKKRRHAVDFTNWGKNKWHDPKNEYDAWEAAREYITNDDIVIKTAVFNEMDSFMDLKPYREKTAEITYAVHITRALEREAAYEKS